VARLEALMLEPPGRPEVDRARTWDFIGWHYFNAKKLDPAARAFEHTVASAPSPRNLTHWAMVETMRGDQAKALKIYGEAVERDSNFTLAWFGVGVAAINTGQRTQVELAARALQRLAPENDKTKEIVRWLEGNAPAR
jgi:tetratricopeptide (TPR) repeat protein